MSLPQHRAADRERKAARIFGQKRNIRKTKGKTPDVLPFELPSGEFVQLEVKNGMKRCPRVLVKALDQAHGYTPNAVAIAIFSDVGGTDIACLSAKTLARWLGIEPEKLAPKLPKPKKAKRSFKQLDLFNSGLCPEPRAVNSGLCPEPRAVNVSGSEPEQASEEQNPPSSPPPQEAC
jgi:hypothetical protein